MKNLGGKRLCLSILIFFTVLLEICSANPTNSEKPPILVTEGAVWAWSEVNNNQLAVFISQQDGVAWREPEKISNNKDLNLVPVVTKTSTQDLIVIWSAFNGEQSQLHYKEFKDGVWLEEKEYYSGLTSNTAPTVGIDKEGELWLAWAGFNGVNDEIYYTRWDGSAFETARAITSNNVPDILPVLGVDEDTKILWIQWQQFTEKGYIEYETTWNGTNWTEPVVVNSENETGTPQETTTTQNRLLKRPVVLTSVENATSDKLTGQIVTKNQNHEIEIPTFVSYLSSASIHIPGYAVQSLPVRNMLSVE